MARIEFKTGDLLGADAEALVNAVNCVGSMGAGIALQFRTRFPANYDAYRAACRAGKARTGVLLVFATGAQTNPKYIVNFPTKRHWREPRRLEDVKNGLDALAAEIAVRNIRSIAIPALGCGLGGLDWLEVRARILRAMEQLGDVHVQIFPPGAAMQKPDAVA